MFSLFPNAAAATQAASQPSSPVYHVAWDKWFSIYNWHLAVTASAILLLILVLGLAITRIFRRQLQAYKLAGATTWLFIACGLYFTVLTLHPYLMVDTYDVLALIINKGFVAILVMVALRFLDRLVILPVLTRISKSTPSRFVHQIIVVVIAVFMAAGYCSWAFNIEIGSFLAGSAVISIVLGLALQETLGNFFSGMVLQASVPFQPGDWIQVGSTEGRVVEMTWRAVTLLTRSNNYILIPNSTVAKEQITNYHSPSVATAASISVGLEYSLPPNDAKRVLVAAAKDAVGVLATPEPAALLASFDDSAITYKLVFWINEPQMHGAVEERVRSCAWYRLNQAGYNIPFPMRTVEMTDAEKNRVTTEDSARARRLAVIQKSPLFANLSVDLQEKLASRTRDFPLAAGQVFYRQGDAGSSLYLLESGTVGVIIQTQESAVAGGAPMTRSVDAGDMTAPAIFGEISALTSEPRGATITAKTDVCALRIDQDHLHDLFAQDPTLMAHISQVVSERQKHREDVLRQLGAHATTHNEPSQPSNVLDRMRRLFTRHNR